MVNFYVKMINTGRLTLDQVPALWHDQVREKLVESETPVE